MSLPPRAKTVTVSADTEDEVFVLFLKPFMISCVSGERIVEDQVWRFVYLQAET